MHPSPFHRASCALAFALLALAGCADVSNRVDVYEEPVPAGGLSDMRTFAYRITLFEYSRTVGGFIEFFAIDDERNTAVNPYFEPTACAYFGAGRLQNGEFPVDVDGVHGARFLMTARLDEGGGRMVGALVQPGGTWPGELPPEGARVTLERVDAPALRSCPIPETLSDLGQTP